MESEGEFVSMVSFAILVATFALAWYIILGLRPAVARAALRRDVASIRADLVDAMLDGRLQFDNRGVEDLIAWCDELIERPDQYSWVSSSGILNVCREQSMLPLGRGTQDIHEVCAEGRKILHDSRADLDKVVGDYLVRSSPIWPLLTLARSIMQVAARMRKDTSIASRRGVVGRANPTYVAKELREAAASEHRIVEREGAILAGVNLMRPIGHLG